LTHLFLETFGGPSSEILGYEIATFLRCALAESFLQRMRCFDASAYCASDDDVAFDESGVSSALRTPIVASIDKATKTNNDMNFMRPS
jgi:hypothetical protein